MHRRSPSPSKIPHDPLRQWTVTQLKTQIHSVNTALSALMAQGDQLHHTKTLLEEELATRPIQPLT